MDNVVPEFELQQKLQRFSTEFVERISQATERLDRLASQRARDEALRKSLLYASAATEIASGAYAEVNLLDMYVFLHLSRHVLESHWIPEVYGSAGDELLTAFEKAERDLDEITSTTLTESQSAQLDSIVEEWLRENPSQIRVEGIRFADFAEEASSAAADRTVGAKGLLSSVRSASRAANHALLLSERGLFLLHRLPFLWRMQARLGAREVLNDAIAQLTEGPDAALVRVAHRGRQFAVRAALAFAAISVGGVAAWRLARGARR